jgi:hypothetical protein
VHLSPSKFCGDQVRPIEARVAQIGSVESGACQERHVKVRASQVDPSEVGFSQVRTVQVGAGKILAAQIHAYKTAATKAAPAEICERRDLRSHSSIPLPPHDHHEAMVAGRAPVVQRLSADRAAVGGRVLAAIPLGRHR